MKTTNFFQKKSKRAYEHQRQYMFIIWWAHAWEGTPNAPETKHIIFMFSNPSGVFYTITLVLTLPNPNREKQLL